METITAEEVNDFRQLLEDDLQEQSPTVEGSLPWEEKRLLSWSDFYLLLNRYCAHRGWRFLSDGLDHFSLAIFASEDTATNEAEELQGRLPFAEDGLPF